MTTTYTVKSKKDGFVWEFKYSLNGHLKSFKLLQGQLSETQTNWLFTGGNFPYNVEIMTSVWMVKLKKNFETTVGEADLSFENFWNTYAHKVGKKKMAENAWQKMSKANKIKALIGIKKYENNLRLYPGQAKAHPSTYLNQEYYNNEY